MDFILLIPHSPEVRFVTAPGSEKGEGGRGGAPCFSGQDPQGCESHAVSVAECWCSSGRVDCKLTLALPKSRAILLSVVGAVIPGVLVVLCSLRIREKLPS